MQSLYSDPTLQAVIDKLNADGPKELKGKYYQGDPIAVDQNQLPIAFITKDITAFQPDEMARGQETHLMGVTISVIYNGASDMYRNASLQAGTVSLWDIVEGRDQETMQLKSDTIAYQLRKNTVLNGNNKLYIDVQGQTTAEYGVTTPERRGLWVTEALVRTNLRINQLKPS